MINERQTFFRFDWFFLLAALVLMVLGILFIYSSGITNDGRNVSTEWMRQIVWSMAGLVVFFVLSFINYEFHAEWSMWYYILFLVLVLLTVFTGKVINGARSWIGIGELGIQPSEFLKVATVLFSAKVFIGFDQTRPFRSFLRCSTIAMIPVGAILMQPDLGTALVFVPMLLFIALIAGSPLRYVVFIALLAGLTLTFILLPSWDEFIYSGTVPAFQIFNNPTLVGVVALVLAIIVLVAALSLRSLKASYFYWIAYSGSLILISFLAAFAARHILKPYQIERLIVFLDPYVDAKGAGWNIIQSVTAVGSGGINGKGFLLGTQSHLRYLPEQSTDFIFSIISEEMGFIGALLIFSLYLLIIIRGLYVAYKAKNPYGSLVAAGIAGIFFFHFMINIGMTIGVMPITGIPLLLLSYGGSSVLSSMAALGLLSSISAHRFK